MQSDDFIKTTKNEEVLVSYAIIAKFASLPNSTHGIICFVIQATDVMGPTEIKGHLVL